MRINYLQLIISGCLDEELRNKLDRKITYHRIKLMDLN